LDNTSCIFRFFDNQTCSGVVEEANAPMDFNKRFEFTYVARRSDEIWKKDLP
jgi:hypothetical protein